MTKLHFATMQEARYNAVTGELIDSSAVREWAVSDIAGIVGNMGKAFGKPEVTEGIEERNGYPTTTLAFPPSKSGAQTYVWITGLSLNDLRELYRAANPKPVRISDRGCSRCGGTGIYVWGTIVNGVPTHQGVCFRCLGSGDETKPKGRGSNAPAPAGEDFAKPKRTTGKNRPTINRSTLAVLVAEGALTADQASLYLPRR